MKKIKKWIVTMLIFGLVIPAVSYGEKAEASELDEEDEIFEEAFLEVFNDSPTIEETVLWDEKDVKITATSLDYDMWYVILNLTIENNSDQTLEFIAGSTSYNWTAINGYMITDGYLNESVDPGETIYAYISFDTDNLSIYGINEIANIQLNIKVRNEDGNCFYLKDGKVETSIADSYDYDVDTFQDVIDSNLFTQLTEYKVDWLSFDELYSSNGISMISEALTTPQEGAFSDSSHYKNSTILLLEMENDSEHRIYVDISDIYINNESIYSRSWTTNEMLPEVKSIVDLELLDIIRRSSNDDIDSDTYFDENNIESVSFTLSIKNENQQDALTPREITINFD